MRPTGYQATLNLVDLAVVDHFGGSVCPSAVSIGGDLLTFLANMCIGSSNGGQVMISQAVCKWDHRAVRTYQSGPPAQPGGLTLGQSSFVPRFLPGCRERRVLPKWSMVFFSAALSLSEADHSAADPLAEHSTPP